MNTIQNLAQNADAKVVRNVRECQCGNFANEETGARIECHAETLRTFAPGHDAKLKGFLIRVGAEGGMIRTLGGEVADPITVANLFGFGHMVAAGIKRAMDKAAAKVAPKPRVVRAKVGRWVYEGTVTAGGGIFSYTDRKGHNLMAEKFTIVD